MLLLLSGFESMSTGFGIFQTALNSGGSSSSEAAFAIRKDLLGAVGCLGVAVPPYGLLVPDLDLLEVTDGFG